MRDTTAQAISTVGIWVAVAIILTFGVFRVDWNGVGVLALLIIVAIICAAAGCGTVAVWGQLRPSQSASGTTEKGGTDKTSA